MKLSKLWLGIKIGLSLANKLEDSHILPNGMISNATHVSGSVVKAIDATVDEFTHK
jgi:hypothetical protein